VRWFCRVSCTHRSFAPSVFINISGERIEVRVSWGKLGVPGKVKNTGEGPRQ
jgi:hypothetical protein